MLVDIVSKNGNLLLSIPVRGDGTIDQHEVDFLEDMAEWMDINSEAIFATRPWKIFGGGPTQAGSGMFGESRYRPFTAQDVRFTTKSRQNGNEEGDTLYAILLGWPGDKKTIIESLATDSPHVAGRKITDVSLLGYDGSLEWTQTEKGLMVKMPDRQPCDYAMSLKIKGVPLK